jgi:hypothetical protein
MKKTLFVTLLALIILSFSVSAWHCTDTDASKPAKVGNIYPPWGDNQLLNGTTAGWGATNTAPLGCTGTQGNYVCKDKCDGTTLIEYSCIARVGHGSETIITFKNYENSVQCGYEEVPEFGVVAGAIALIAGLGIIAYKRK